MTSALSSARVLVLSSSYEPVRIVPWQRAMLLYLSEKIEVLENYGDLMVHTVSQAFQVPAVVRMTRYVYPRARVRRARFTRHHVFARDRHTCQYCRHVFAERELTLDHVVPVVHGGRTSWSNIVTCCVACNQRKGSQTPQEAGLRLMSVPKEPQGDFLPDLIFYQGSALPEPWRPFLPNRYLL